MKAGHNQSSPVTDAVIYRWIATLLEGNLSFRLRFRRDLSIEEMTMVTTVGTETTFEKLVQNLLILEHDAIAAYDSTIEKLDDESYKAKIAEFRNDHLQHVTELKRLAEKLSIEAPTEGDMKQYLTTGKIALAGIIGDKTILKAMSTNEIETKMAYDHASKNMAASSDAMAFFRQAYSDEDKHKAWMDQTAAS